MGNLIPLDKDGRYRDADTGDIGYLLRSGSTVTFVEVDDWDTEAPDPAAVVLPITPDGEIPPDQGDPGHP